MAIAPRTRRAVAPAEKVTPVQVRKASSEPANVHVDANLSRKRSQLGGKSKQFDLEPVEFGPGEHPAIIRVGVGATHNLGDFNSLRIDVSVQLPCKVDQIDEAKKVAADLASEYLQQEEELWLASRPPV